MDNEENGKKKESILRHVHLYSFIKSIGEGLITVVALIIFLF